MAKILSSFSNLPSNYLFKEVADKKKQFLQSHPSCELYDLGIGDVCSALSSSLIDALQKAAKEMGTNSGFRGYGPPEGYSFLKEMIAKKEYRNLGISSDEIFISDGIKNSLSSFQNLFCTTNRVAICDPTYPVYLETNSIRGRNSILIIPCHENNQFIPLPPEEHVDLIYLCSPNNPTGVGIPKEILTLWIEYAKRENALILFDGAYESFITTKTVPHSIYEIPSANEVAIEFRSFSKMYGFTGLRLSYLVIPKIIQRNNQSLHSLWKRMIDTTYGGTCYLIQKAALATYSKKGQKERETQFTIYQSNAKKIRTILQKKGFTLYGGIDSPYVWCKTPSSFTSWKFFDYLLEKAQVITIPGIGFGKQGEGYVRFSSFPSPKIIEKALQNIDRLF